MTARPVGLGCTPFLMSKLEYGVAVAAAAAAGVGLPVDDRPMPATPWDPGLSHAFAQHRLIVHEERVMTQVLTAHARSNRRRPMVRSGQPKRVRRPPFRTLVQT